MAGENLYGAPYWDRQTYSTWLSEGNSPEKDNILFFTEDKTLTSSFSPIKKRLEERILDLRVDHSFTELLKSLHEQESRLLGCSEGNISTTIQDINKFLQEEEQTILDWCLKMLKDTEINESVELNPNAQIKPIDFSNIPATLQRLEDAVKRNKEKSSIAEMIHALAKGTLSNKLAGPQGELAAAINMLFAKAKNKGLNITAKELIAQIPEFFTGKSGVKIDIQIPYLEEPIPISVKNYSSIRNTSTQQLFNNDAFQDLTIQSGKGLVGFLKYLEANLDRDLQWNDIQLNNFNVYLINLFYFRYYQKTKSMATDLIDNIREVINQLLTLYAPAFLMTGTSTEVKKNSPSFYNRIMQQVKDGEAAVFFYLSGHGLLPMSEIIKILHKEEKNVKAKLELHTTNVENNIPAVDVLDANGTEYKRSKTLTNVIRGVFGGGPNARVVIQDRYNLYSGGGTVGRGTESANKYDPIGTNIQLKIQMSALKKYMPL